MESVKNEGESISNKNSSTASILQKIIQNQKNPIVDKHPGISKNWTFGEKAADYMASKMGSWGFLIGFFFFLLFWIGTNALALIERWDPYPFIFLNLILSCIAAVQAPIILMAQNRQAQKDRIRMEYDYAVNRKSEREIESIKSQLDRIESKLR